MLAWGVSTGHVLMGEHVLASRLSDLSASTGTTAGGLAGAAFAGTLLKGLFIGGVTGVQGTIAVPALVLVGGGALILSAFGYTAGDIAGRLLEPDLSDLIGTASVLTVGLALLVDGTRRFIKDERILAASARLADGVIHLTQQTGEIIATTLEELKSVAQEFSGTPSMAAAAGAGAALAGGTVGASLAAGSVTVLGSHTLGAAAVSLGLVSAPVWPIVACGAAGLAAGAAVFLAAKRYIRRNNDRGQPSS